MSNPPPTPPDGGQQPQSNRFSGRPDARTFFLNRYNALLEVPTSSYDPDIAAFESTYGDACGYTRDELKASIRAVREELRKARGPRQQEAADQLPGNQRVWARWILGITFGIYILAAIGTISYAAVFLKLGWSWEALQPFVGGVVALGVVLLLLSFGWTSLRQAPLTDRIKSIFATVILVFVLAIASGAVIWIVTLMLQMAGWIPKPGPKAVAPPGDFLHDEAWTCSDDKYLPAELFGVFGKDIEKPREWMRTLEAGSRGMLNDPKAQVCWVLTKERANTKYEARINVGTLDDIVIIAFEVVPPQDADASSSMVPLRQVYSADKAEYGFTVPAAQHLAPLLFFIAMKEATFKKWHDEQQKFVIKS
jgi:hypothetical protein